MLGDGVWFFWISCSHSFLLRNLLLFERGVALRANILLFFRRLVRTTRAVVLRYVVYSVDLQEAPPY